MDGILAEWDIEDVSVDEDEQDFKACEIQHNEEFGSLNRIGCFSHTLQLVVSKFDDFSLFKGVMKRAHLVVCKVNASTKATERLVALVGKKLVKDCPTRWSSTYFMVTRLIDVKEKLKVVLKEQGWNDLAASEWRTLTHIANLLQPFAIRQIHKTSQWGRVYHIVMCRAGCYGYEHSPSGGMLLCGTACMCVCVCVN